MHRCQSFCHNQRINLNEYKQIAKHELFHDGGSCRRNQSIDLFCKSLICSANQWTVFCIIGTSVMRDSRRSSSTYTHSMFLDIAKHFFFYVAFLLRIFLIHTTAGKRGGSFLRFFLSLPLALQTRNH